MTTKGIKKFYLLLLAFQIVLVISVLFSVNVIRGMAQTETAAVESNASDVAKYLAIAAALAIGLSVLGAGIAIKTTGTAAISLLSEHPEEFFKGFLVVALGEALAVYGLIVGILLWTRIPVLTI